MEQKEEEREFKEENISNEQINNSAEVGTIQNTFDVGNNVQPVGPVSLVQGENVSNGQINNSAVVGTIQNTFDVGNNVQSVKPVSLLQEENVSNGQINGSVEVGTIQNTVEVENSVQPVGPVSLVQEENISNGQINGSVEVGTIQNTVEVENVVQPVGSVSLEQEENISNGQINNTNVVEPEGNNNLEQNGKVSKLKGKNIVIIIVAVLLLIFAGLFIFLILQYNGGKKAFDDKNYLEAISKYEKISWYSDTKERLAETYFEYGKELMDNDDCQTALSYFDKAKLDENNEHVKYCEMFVKYYDDFQSAEKEYEDGNLLKAQEIYKKIDKSFKYHDITVADRLATLKEYEKFVNLTGTKSGSGKMEVRQIYKRDGSWESWTGDYSNSCDVTAKIQPDGTVKIDVVARFYSFSKYSTLSYALGDKQYTAYYSVTVKKDGSIPSKFGSFPAAIAPSGTTGNATLTYSKGRFTLDFLLDDKNYSQYFRNKFTSKITYK